MKIIEYENRQSKEKKQETHRKKGFLALAFLFFFVFKKQNYNSTTVPIKTGILF